MKNSKPANYQQYEIIEAGGLSFALLWNNRAIAALNIAADDHRYQSAARRSMAT
jgi:hypothetical protein